MKNYKIIKKLNTLKSDFSKYKSFKKTNLNTKKKRKQI